MSVKGLGRLALSFYYAKPYYLENVLILFYDLHITLLSKTELAGQYTQ